MKEEDRQLLEEQDTRRSCSQASVAESICTSGQACVTETYREKTALALTHLLWLENAFTIENINSVFYPF